MTARYPDSDPAGCRRQSTEDGALGDAGGSGREAQRPRGIEFRDHTAPGRKDAGNKGRRKQSSDRPMPVIPRYRNDPACVQRTWP